MQGTMLVDKSTYPQLDSNLKWKFKGRLNPIVQFKSHAIAQVSNTLMRDMRDIHARMSH